MKKLGVILAAFAFPVIVSAQQQVNSVQDLGKFVIDLINNLAVPLVFSAAFIVFIWGIFKYFILGGQNEEKRGEGQALMIWGIVGFFLMLSVWGLVNILTGSIGLNKAVPAYPAAPTNRTGNF